ncbi:hypothetical protein FDECE_15064 [Fusarium decemcellulare]|nr:hypothetical protein FDECE_15064 [Fusarium decemcellulare]
MVACSHGALYTDCSPAAAVAGFKRPIVSQRLAAVSQTGRRSRGPTSTHEETMKDPLTFPGPLVLPGDDLYEDPDDSAQSFKSWHDYAGRNHITSRRKTIYVVSPPEITPEVEELMKDWEKPVLPKSAINAGLPKWTSSTPQIKDLVDYLHAFYHLMDVKELNAKFKWRPWEEDESQTKSKSKKSKPAYVGLETPGVPELIRVRCRPSLDGVARMQMSLNDMLDALIGRIPEDAYAIVMLNDFDQYEDEYDTDCSGRAYGGSRIAIVSSFRYNPSLDKHHEVDPNHMWPASHCKAYVDKFCAAEGVEQPRPAKKARMPNSEQTSEESAISAAIQNSKRVPKPRTRDELASYWFSRIANTVAHELGHTFGMGHCTYYACLMQGCTNIRQDTQVPPYLCPVDLAKLSWELGSLLPIAEPPVNLQQRWIKGRSTALKDFCGRWSHVPQLAGFEAWLAKRLEKMEEGEDTEEA